MLTITLIALVLAIPLSYTVITGSDLESNNEKIRKATISATLYTRIVAIALLFAAALSYNCITVLDSTNTLEALDTGVGLYSGLINASVVTQYMEIFLLVSGALILLPWGPNVNNNLPTSGSPKSGIYVQPQIPEYSMLILFTTLGATFLLASSDLVSMYLSIELQSFGVYILAAIYRDSESATAAGLKYFLLGALSSALILLGSALIYSYTGLTNLYSIYELISVPSSVDTNSLFSSSNIVILGIIIISVGLLFKVASAPFHYWAPDVYDGTPTIVTTWLTVMPKISIFLFMLELYLGYASSSLKGLHQNLISFTNPSDLLLICAFLSLVIGTVVGLGQYRIKRLLAYSTISHVGFLLLALAIGSATITVHTDMSNQMVELGGVGEESISAFLFYIIQYTLTNINAFFVLLAFGYVGAAYAVNNKYSTSQSNDVQFTSELQGQFQANPVLGLSFAICLFSMAGIPPLVGFFAKYTVLYSAINNGYLFLGIIAILASVVSAVYYLRIIRVIHFGGSAASFDSINDSNSTSITSVHSYIIASLTLFIALFAVNPSLILNSTSIMALSYFCR